jgi:xanthine dehydrogenase accessory factor
MIQAFVGSGGKTTTIHRRAAAYRAQGLRVFVTTTTHMNIEPDTILGDDPAPILRALRENGYAMAGQSATEGKFGTLSKATYLTICAEADVVLVEADGSRQHPLKFPAAHEPVIPDNADEIIIVAGLIALGHPAHEVCHRLELVKACLNIEDDTIITEKHIETLLQEGYLRPLHLRYPDKKLTVLRVEPGWRNI